jgi:hypothetical protein
MPLTRWHMSLGRMLLKIYLRASEPALMGQLVYTFGSQQSILGLNSQSSLRSQAMLRRTFTARYGEFAPVKYSCKVGCLCFLNC